MNSTWQANVKQPRYSQSRKGIGGRPKGPKTTIVRLPLPIATIARRLAEGTLRAGDINGFIDIQAREHATVPLLVSSASCGFPSPADDYLDRPLDFNELLVQNPAATFAVRIAGDSMSGVGLYPGDIAIIDRSINPAHGCIVLALVEGEFTVKRYLLQPDGIVLRAENPSFKDIHIPQDAAFEVWGVLKHSIRIF